MSSFLVVIRRTRQVGEYGDEIEMSPYILEPLIDGFDTETDADVRLQLLAAAMKLFFKVGWR